MNKTEIAFLGFINSKAALRSADDMFFVAVEGTNGTGKTSVCRMAAARLEQEYQAGVPQAFISNPDLKTMVISSPTYETPILFYLAGLIEQSRCLTELAAKTVVIDRWLWSTMAVHFAHGGNSRLTFATKMLKAVAHKIVRPSLTVCLTADKSALLTRLEAKTEWERRLDYQTCHEGFLAREHLFYQELSVRLNEMRPGSFITLDTTNLSIEQCVNQLMLIIAAAQKCGY